MSDRVGTGVPDSAALGTVIAAAELPVGLIGWFPGGHGDPWNHVEAAMALDSAGESARHAPPMSGSSPLSDALGGWSAYYRPDGSVEEARIDTNASSYLATGLLHHVTPAATGPFSKRAFPTSRRRSTSSSPTNAPRGRSRGASGRTVAGGLRTACRRLLDLPEPHLRPRARRPLGASRPHWVAAPRNASSCDSPPRPLLREQGGVRDGLVLPGPLGLPEGGQGRRELRRRWPEFVLAGRGGPLPLRPPLGDDGGECRARGSRSSASVTGAVPARSSRCSPTRSAPPAATSPASSTPSARVSRARRSRPTPRPRCCSPVTRSRGRRHRRRLRTCSRAAGDGERALRGGPVGHEVAAREGLEVAAPGRLPAPFAAGEDVVENEEAPRCEVRGEAEVVGPADLLAVAAVDEEEAERRRPVRRDTARLADHADDEVLGPGPADRRRASARGCRCAPFAASTVVGSWCSQPGCISSEPW